MTIISKVQISNLTHNCCYGLQGYSALFRHPNDELNYCVYIIPGNPKVTPDDLPHWHEFLKGQDANISKALGPDIEIERMKAGQCVWHPMCELKYREGRLKLSSATFKSLKQVNIKHSKMASNRQ